ncbi:hypothetical protein M9H77_01783 [Catharanthus roseus]|uniref:Uncharacterized protein n=1 Tax=Catharanthus roseus TaxID=4058 RepID=A0ACC0C6L1_CATRO|nr:hypothetical protein M9H77_01783 [Catharanthus roseus]
MDIKNWKRFGSRRSGSIRLGTHYQVLDDSAAAYSNNSNKKKMNKLKGMWRKIFLKEKINKKKDIVFWASARSVHVQFPYDSETYSQNFDEGKVLDEPDFVFRSFSTRFSDPSKIFPQKDLIDIVMLVEHDNADI